MFKYEPDFENSNEYYLCDSELYKLSGYEEVPILDKNSNYKFTEATRLIDRHIESQKEENRNREDYVPINLNKDDIAALTMVATKTSPISSLLDMATSFYQSMQDDWQTSRSRD